MLDKDSVATNEREQRRGGKGNKLLRPNGGLSGPPTLPVGPMISVMACSRQSSVTHQSKFHCCTARVLAGRLCRPSDIRRGVRRRHGGNGCRCPPPRSSLTRNVSAALPRRSTRLSKRRWHPEHRPRPPQPDRWPYAALPERMGNAQFRNHVQTARRPEKRTPCPACGRSIPL